MAVIALDNVTYAYEDGHGRTRTVLRNVSAGFEPGAMTAVVGPSARTAAATSRSSSRSSTSSTT